MKKKIAAGLILSLSFGTIPAYATSIDEIEKQMEENINHAEKMEQEMKTLREEQTVLSKEMDEIAQKISNLSREVAILQGNVETMEAEVDKAEIFIREKQIEMDKIQSDVEKKMDDIKKQEDELKAQEEVLNQRVRSAYKINPSQNMLIILLESTSILDFFDRMFFVKRITDSDHMLINEYNQALGILNKEKEELSELKKIAESEKNALEEEKRVFEEQRKLYLKEKSSLEYNKKAMEELEKEKKIAFERLSEKEQRIAQDIGDIMDENNALEEQIQEMIREAQRKAAEEARRRAEEERRKAEAENRAPVPDTSSDNTSTGWLRPVSGRVTSPFGYRMHPIWKERRFHYGIDYAGATGTSVKSTKSGMVISARYMSGYGNTVIVDHGNGMSSLYAHLNTIEVSVGQNVVQ